MSIILSAEAGGELFSAALRVGGETRQYSAAMPHSRAALPLAQKLLAEAGISLGRCDVFAFGAGPGRFSGLRLACGIAQAFGYAAGRPCAAVDSMAALAEANYGETESRAEAALPAHRGHIYAARCRRKGGRWTGGRPLVLGLEDYAPGLRGRHFCGRGFLENPGLLGRKPEAVLAAAFPEPDAAAVAKIAEAMLSAGEICSAAECRPVYARRQIAQTAAMRAAGGGFS